MYKTAVYTRVNGDMLKVTRLKQQKSQTVILLKQQLDTTILIILNGHTHIHVYEMFKCNHNISNLFICGAAAGNKDNMKASQTNNRNTQKADYYHYTHPENTAWYVQSSLLRSMLSTSDNMSKQCHQDVTYWISCLTQVFF